jgi:Skp family chaperone for outer membrane proteins
MQDRSLAAGRLRAIQAELQRIEQWKFADSQRQLAELERQQQALIAALNDMEKLQDLVLAARARRLRHLAEEIARVRQESEQQARRLLEQTSRAKMAANLSQRADRDARRTAEGKDLSLLLEDRLGRELQASGKIAGP